MAFKFIRNIQNRFDTAETDESGFGNVPKGSGYRLIHPDGSFNIERKGSLLTNLYESLLYLGWRKFIFGLLIFFFVSNAGFALVYMVIGVENIRGFEPGSLFDNFAQSLFFSIQTFTTVGYGYMSPIGYQANLLSSIVSFVGLITFSLATGIFFVKFSRPHPHILFSDNMLVAPNRQGKKSLQFRIVNASHNQLFDLEARVTLAWLEEEDGVMRRKFSRLDLELESIHLFPLNWTIVHPITPESPLYNKTRENFEESKMEVLILIKGYNDTYSTMMHAKRSYSCGELVVNAKFLPMYENDKDKTVLNLAKLNDIEPCSIKPES